MRLGFFYGVNGDGAVLGEALELLSDCERVVSLGDLLSAGGAGAPRGDAECLAAALQSGSVASRLLVLAGPNERRRAHDGALPPEWRGQLRRLPSATVLGGVALLGAAGIASPHAREERAFAGRPHLHAPQTIAPAVSGRTELWVARDGNTHRVDWVAGTVPLAAGARIRLELAGALDDGVLRVAVLDTTLGTLEVRERLRLTSTPTVGARRASRSAPAPRRRAG